VYIASKAKLSGYAWLENRDGRSRTFYSSADASTDKFVGSAIRRGCLVGKLDTTVQLMIGLHALGNRNDTLCPLGTGSGYRTDDVTQAVLQVVREGTPDSKTQQESRL
jgi:hypothetical protein